METVKVLVTDKVRGIYYGSIDLIALEGFRGGGVVLHDARHCFFYAKCEGTYSLATKGPQPGSKIGPVVKRQAISDVATISTCDAAAVAAWEAAGWSS